MALPNEIHPFLVTGNDANQYKVPYSVRIRRSVDAYFSRTFSTPTDQKTWTFSGWFKRGYISLGSNQYIMHARDSGNTVTWELFFGTGDTITVRNYNVSSYNQLMTTNQVFRDPSAWYHIVFVLNTSNSTAADRHRLYINGSRVTSFSSETQPSLNMTSVWNTSGYGHGLAGVSVGSSGTDFDGYMAEVNFIDGQALDSSYFGQTNSLTNQWQPKKYTGAYGNNGFYLPFNNTTPSVVSNLFTYSEDLSNWAGTYQASISTNATTAPNGATTADKLIDTTVSGNHYVSKSSATLSSSTQYTISMYCKAGEWSGIQFYEQIGTFAANFRLTGDGSVLYTQSGATATIVALPNGWYRCSMTFTTGSSQTIYQGSFSIIDDSGSNSFAGTGSKGVYLWGLQISPGASAGPYYVTGSSTITTYQIGQDISGSSVDSSYNNWPSSNFSLYSPANTSTTTHDSYIDSPTSYNDGDRGRGNYCTLNPLNVTSGTFSEGNLYYYGPGSWKGVMGTMALPTTGKWYFESRVSGVPYSPRGSGTSYQWIGVGLSTNFNVASAPSANDVRGLLLGDNGFLNNFTSSPTDLSITIANGDIIGVAIDNDANTYTFYRNNSSIASGTINITAGTQLSPMLVSYDSNYGIMKLNFGQRPFSYTPPAGFKALNSYNLANPSLPLV